ncbi:NAD-P-binding protein [Cubamyces sp. BRFM 1775]|nr:NAD-P-binding protein [Cubamyces sp. BRFM 1775]
MSSSQVSIFLTGATGYIGGSILKRLLSHPNHKNFEITALVRNADKAKVLETQFGVKTVLGSLEDSDKLTALAESAHITINTAGCDDLVVIEAILRGLKQRRKKTGDIPHYIHTSGTGEFTDNARGEYASETVYSDLDIPTIEALPPNALHRPGDLLVVAADAEENYARTHIVMPSQVWGVATGPLVDAGIANPHTIVVPLFVRAALKRGSIGVMGQGVTRWTNVHVDDVADGGLLILDNGELEMREILQAIADALFALGRVSTRELVPYAPGEAGQYLINEFIAELMFTNARTKGERARRELGWAPRYTSQDFLERLPEEIKVLVKKEDGKTGV